MSKAIETKIVPAMTTTTMKPVPENLQLEQTNSFSRQKKSKAFTIPGKASNFEVFLNFF